MILIIIFGFIDCEIWLLVLDKRDGKCWEGKWKILEVVERGGSEGKVGVLGFWGGVL